MIRRIGNELKFMYPKQYILISSSLILLISILSVTEGRQVKTAGDLIMLLLGGARSGIDYVSYIKVMPWLIINMLFAGIILLYCNMEINHRIYLVLSRYRSYAQWWDVKFASVLLSSVIYSLGAVLLISTVGCLHTGFSFGLTGEYSFASIGWLVPLYTASCCLIGTLLLLCFVYSASLRTCLIVLAVSLIVPITLSWTAPDTSAWLFGNWGMLKKSSVIDTPYGFSSEIVLGVEALIIIALFFLGRSRIAVKEICSKVNAE